MFSLIKDLLIFFLSKLHIPNLDKCMVLGCGNGHCQVNQTTYKATCTCERGYEFNQEKGKCENCEF